MQSKLPMHLSPRCRATSKQSDKPCQGPAVSGHKVCRMHGARGGPPEGNRNAHKHGRYTAEAINQRRAIAVLLRECREIVEGVE